MSRKFALLILLMLSCLQSHPAKAQTSSPPDRSPAEAEVPQDQHSSPEAAAPAQPADYEPTTGSAMLGNWTSDWMMANVQHSPFFDLKLENGTYRFENEFTYESLMDRGVRTQPSSWNRTEVEYQLGTLANRPLVVTINAPGGARIAKTGDEVGIASSLVALAQKIEQKVGAPVELCQGKRECVETCKLQKQEGCCKWRCKKVTGAYAHE
jgi:hypothetical protein